MLVDSKLCIDKIDFRQEISNSNKFDRDKWISFIRSRDLVQRQPMLGHFG